MSRQVLAEAPSFAFMLLGLWVWIKSWSKKSGWLIAATLLIALSVITKNQLIWVLVPGFALIILANRIYYRQLHWTHEFMPLAGIIIGYVIWLAISLWIVGPTDRASYLETQSALTRASFLHVTPQRWLANLKLLFRSEQWLMALAALIYGFWASRKRSRAGFERLVLPLFAGMAMMSFLVMSLPWARYLYPALALTALCSALLITDLTRWLTERRKLNGLLTATLLIVIVMLLAGPRLVQNIYRITTTNDNSAEKFAALVEQRVPADSNVLNWEWEIEFYSRRSFTHPPYLLFPALIDQVYNQRNSPILEEPRLPPAIDYLIVGPFATETQVFNSALTQRGHQLLASEGPYQLYQLD
jgi:hypothetical protein